MAACAKRGWPGCTAVSVVTGLGVLASCSAPRRTFEPAQDPSTLDDTAFVHYLASVPMVTVGEGSRAVLLLIGPTTQWPTPQQQTGELQDRGAIRATRRLEPDATLDKGTLAYMLRTVCHVPRSLNEVLVAPTGLGDRRYALRTCIDEGLLPYGLPNDPVTGGELLSALTRAERRMGLRTASNP